MTRQARRAAAARSLALGILAALPAGLALVPGACTGDLPSVNKVDKLRILAVRAEPPDLALDETTRLEALVADPKGGGRPVDVVWAVCDPRQLIDSVTEDCRPGTEVPLAPGPDGTVALAPLDLLAAFPADGGVPAGSPDGGAGGGRLPLPVVVRASAGGERVVALKRVVVSAAGPRNRNPRLLALVAGGVPWFADQPPTVRREGKLRLRAVEAPRDFEVFDKDQPDAGVPAEPEQHSVAWYTSAGKLDHNSTASGVVDAGVVYEDVEFTAPGEPGIVQIWAVLLDGRGGVHWERRTIVVE